MAKKNRLGLAWLLPVVPVAVGLLLLLTNSLPVQALRNNLFDQYQRWQPRTYVQAPVRIIDIDDESLSRLGQWPWPRTRLAELVDRLSGAGVAAIGFDVIFAEPDRTSPKSAAEFWGLGSRLRKELAALPDHDQVFADHLRRANAVLGFAVERSRPGPGDTSSVQLPQHMARFVYSGEQPKQWLHSFQQAVTALPILASAAKGNGALTFVPDGDGVVRRVPLVLQVEGRTVPTLVSEMLRVGQGASNMIVRSAEHHGGLAEVKIGELTIPTSPQGEIWVHYAPEVRERYIPAWRLFAGEIPRALLEGHLILVGSSAQGLMDLRFNPLGRIMPGIEAHAQALEQILTGDSLLRPTWAIGVEVVALVIFGFGIGLLTLRTRSLIAASFTMLALVVILGSGWYAFSGQGLLIDTATPAIAVVLSFIFSSVYQHFVSEREQRWIKDAFSRYVSPNRVSYLVENPDAMTLGGLRQECSFIFTDLAGFTSLMERIDPADAVALLNTYLDGMIAIAFRHEGTLDRIVGDAVAIMFSAPVIQADHRSRALACALEMDAFSAEHAQGLQAKGIAFGKTRIGVHSGEVIVGNFGGSTIFDYRALGDTVNTAARLESVNKHLGTRMCVSAATLAGCPDARARPVGRLVLKGKSEALQVFEPLTDSLSDIRSPTDDYLAAYAALQNGAANARELFDDLAARYPQDPLIALHKLRLEHGESGDLVVMQEK